MSSTVNRIAAVRWMFGWSLFVYRGTMCRNQRIEKEYHWQILYKSKRKQLTLRNGNGGRVEAPNDS